MKKYKPYYRTKCGLAYLGNSIELLDVFEDGTVDLIMTSPTFALGRKKEYGNVDAEKCIEWFLPFAERFYDILKPKGSLVIDIGGSWIPGKPVRSLYHYELLLALCKKPTRKFYLAQEFFLV